MITLNYQGTQSSEMQVIHPRLLVLCLGTAHWTRLAAQHTQPLPCLAPSPALSASLS